MRSSVSSAAVSAVPLAAGSIALCDLPGLNTPWWKVWQIDPVIALTIAGRCLGLAAGIVGSVVTARFLQPVGRGEYFVALTTAQLLAQFGNFGLHSGNTYFVARDPKRFSGLLANSLWLSFLGVPVLGMILLLVWSWGGSGGMSSATGWFAVALAPLLVFNLLGNGLFVGLNQMKTYSVMQPLSAAILLPFILIAATLGYGPTGFLTASLLAWMFTIAIMLTLLFRQSHGVGGFRADIFKTTFRYSTKVYLATLAGFVVLRMNVFVLHAVAGPEQVGYYSVASQIADTLSILPQSIATVLFPRLVANQSGRISATIRSAAHSGVWLGLACTLLWFLADPAIRLAFGPRFAPAGPVLRSMLPGVFLLGITSVMSQYLAASGFPRSVVITWFGAVALSACLSGILVSRHGAVGAGETLSVTYGALLVVLLILCWRSATAEAAKLAARGRP